MFELVEIWKNKQTKKMHGPKKKEEKKKERYEKQKFSFSPHLCSDTALIKQEVSWAFSSSKKTIYVN